MKTWIGAIALAYLTACSTNTPAGADTQMTSEPKITPEEAAFQWESVLKNMTPEARAEFEALQAKERARPKVESLTPDLMRSIPDEYLDASLIEYINGRLHPSNYSRSALLRLPRGLQVFYLTFIVEAEVMNGGLNQFFWNSSSEYAELVGHALRDLGAPDGAALFEQALSIATQDLPRLASLRKSGTLQSFSDSYKDNPLNALDAPFSRMAADFSQLRLQYARRHVEAFF